MHRERVCFVGPSTLLAAALAVPGALGQDCVSAVTPHPVRAVQPDGRVVELKMRGGAWAHWYEDADGFPVVRVDGEYVYARLAASGELVPTPARVGRDDPQIAGIAAGVVPSNPSGLARAQAPSPFGHGGTAPAAVANGTVENLVLLVRFSDHGPQGQNRTLPSAADVDVIMNALGGDPVLAPTGSVKDHYLESSYGQFAFQSTSVGWLDLPNSEAHYANGNSGLTVLTWDLIRDALDLADPQVDFSQYDQNGDGAIDAITFLHSGYGAEWGGDDVYGTNYVDRMWSHKWTINPAWTSAEGVTVSEYSISPGLWDTAGSEPGHIGVVCHELGHFIGLPDQYDTDGSSEGLGNWCLMAAGSWGFDGEQQHPSHMCAWCKSKLGWITPALALPGLVSAGPVETAPTAFRLDSGYPPGEYLLIENRQPIGFDAVIPQAGLAIWHVDDVKGSYPWNDVNNAEGFPGQPAWPTNGNHYRIALLQADAAFEMELGYNRGDAGDVYHEAGITHLTGFTVPDANAYQGGNVIGNGNEIVGIGHVGAGVDFTLQNTDPVTITTAALPPAKLGQAYALNLTAAGGLGPYRWSEYRSNPVYTAVDEGPAAFAFGGVAQGWNADNGLWALTLPFDLPYWETSYDTLYVSSNGYVDLVPSEFSDAYNQHTHLPLSWRIAPLWDDLRTTGAGEDIFVDTSVPGRVVITWIASTFSGDPVEVALELFANGDLVFQYGAGNTNLTPTVGISGGHSGYCEFVAPHDGAASLTDAHTIRFTLAGSELPPGLALSASGSLTGVPTQKGAWSPTLRATDGRFVYDQRTFTLPVIEDCNGNDVDDPIDIAFGTSVDCNQNGVPDECEATPFAYCTAKVNNLGCTPQIAWAGLASASDPNPFLITAGNVLNQKSGLLFYGTSGPAALPFFGGTLCVFPSLQRTPIQNSTGNPPPEDCSGQYSFDFNAQIQSGTDPALVAGATVNAQYWTRDPNHPDGTGVGLTDAVELDICP